MDLTNNAAQEIGPQISLNTEIVSLVNESYEAYLDIFKSRPQHIKVIGDSKPLLYRQIHRQKNLHIFNDNTFLTFVHITKNMTCNIHQSPESQNTYHTLES